MNGVEEEGEDDSEVEAHAPTNGLNTEEDQDCTLDDIEVPKILGDIVESIIGAVYLDSKCSLECTWNVIKKLIPEIVKDPSFGHVKLDNVRVLYETFGKTMKLELLDNKGKPT